jgi:hypothetical protein
LNQLPAEELGTSLVNLKFLELQNYEWGEVKGIEMQRESSKSAVK